MYRCNSLNQKVYESFRISEDVERVIRYAHDVAGNMTEMREGIEKRFLRNCLKIAFNIACLYL